MDKWKRLFIVLVTVLEVVKLVSCQQDTFTSKNDRPLDNKESNRYPKASETSISADDRLGRLLPVLSVITFPNDRCDGASRNGTCYTSEECSNRGGTSSGSCASGFGVCCVFELACGGTASENNTYLVQASATSIASPCRYTICPCSSNICRIRYDFTSHVLTDPPLGTTVATGTAPPSSTTGGAIGHCTSDQFSITSGSGGSGSPVICGTNTGYHMILDANTACQTANFEIGSNSVARQWDIYVRQFACGEEDVAGPPGCLQYFTATTDRVSSYNFPASTTVDAAATHLADQQYTNCIRRAAGQCFICYAPVLPGAAAAINQGGFGLSVSPAVIAVGGINTECTADYLTIPGGAATPGTFDTTVATKFCGRFFGTTTATTANETVCTRQAPFTIGVNFDSDEVAIGVDPAMADMNELNDFPGGTVGFSFVYTQGACT